MFFKLVERAAADQLQSHLVKNNLFPTLQSAYRPNHSTETALLKIKNDILMNMDKQHATLLILLDLSAAFDTVDHQILLNRLRTEFGVSGKKVLDWFASYLSNRSQKVTVDGVLSDRFGTDFGVPQGSCLGPLLFVIYSSKLFNIVNRHLPNVMPMLMTLSYIWPLNPVITPTKLLLCHLYNPAFVIFRTGC